MGQQQLLLIILGVIVVGIAVAVGITMFTDNAVSANRDAVTNDLVNLASRAQQYYRRPASMGGGEGSFVGLSADVAGLQKLTSKPRNSNGRYWIETAGSATQVVLHAMGREVAGPGATDTVEIQMTVKSDSATANVIH